MHLRSHAMGNSFSLAVGVEKSFENNPHHRLQNCLQTEQWSCYKTVVLRSLFPRNLLAILTPLRYSLFQLQLQRLSIDQHGHYCYAISFFSNAVCRIMLSPNSVALKCVYATRLTPIFSAHQLFNL